MAAKDAFYLHRKNSVMSLLPNGTIHLPNPLTPLAFLAPEEAYLTSVRIYASVAALAVSWLDRHFGGKILHVLFQTNRYWYGISWTMSSMIITCSSLNCTFPWLHTSPPGTNF